ncbi:MAG: hypothetical protein HFE30_03050, partial [Clostridiales bacterium]|nr:hypothetical protein [Clostridiales bacterium]
MLLTGEVVSEEVSRQEFDYGVNKENCNEEDHENTNLSTLSSNGVLELQPIYGWGDLDHITANDKIYHEFGGTSNGVWGVSGASIWNSDSSCYLKQNMGLVWMGNDQYQVQYRFEWKKEPYFKLVDHFAVAPAKGLIVHEDSRESLTLKFKYAGKDYTETLTQPAFKTALSKMRNLSMGQGRQISFNWLYDDNTIKPYELKGFFTYYARITEPYVSNTFIVYAQYYHGTVQPSINSS